LEGDKKDETNVDKKNEPNSEPSKSYLPYSDDAYDEIEQISSADALLDYAESKEGLSDEQRKKLKDLAADWEDAEGEMAMGGDDDEYEEASSLISAKAMEVVLGPYDTWPEPKQDEPKSEPSQPKREGDPEVNKATLSKAKKLGITPQKLGKEEYQKKMAQAAVAALTDANYHTEARELIAKLEGKPEWAEDPRKSQPDIDSPEYDKWAKSSVYSSEYYDAEGEVEELGIGAANDASWDGEKAADSIAYTLRQNGFDELADKIQSVIKENKSTRLKDLL